MWLMFFDYDDKVIRIPFYWFELKPVNPWKCSSPTVDFWPSLSMLLNRSSVTFSSIRSTITFLGPLKVANGYWACFPRCTTLGFREQFANPALYGPSQRYPWYKAIQKFARSIGRAWYPVVLIGTYTKTLLIYYTNNMQIILFQTRWLNTHRSPDFANQYRVNIFNLL